jgi:hypothetical protein
VCSSDLAEKNSKCKKITYNVILKEQTDPVRFERHYYFSSDSSEPIYEIVEGIFTNSEEEFETLNLKIFDEKNNELDISKILEVTPLSKKIVVKLTTPVFNGDSGRMLKIAYDVKISKNIFKNFFLTETSNFELNFSYFANVNLTPNLYYVDNEHGSKSLIEQISTTTKGMFTNNKWEKTQGINVKDIISLEW